jgi:transposase-like protein
MRPLSPSLFHGRHFDRAIIVLCVRWYITYKLSYRDLVELMAERGVDVSHTTILRWVQHYVPEFAKRWSRYARPVGTSWRVDETYIRVGGRWTYLYRAVDKRGLTVDFLLSEHRDISAAKQFFTRAIERHGAPERITLDGYPATHAAVAELKESGMLRPQTKVWTSKYLGSGSIRGESQRFVVVVQKESQTQLVHRVGLGKRQALPDEAPEPLPQCVVPSLDVRCQATLFASGRVLLGREH